MENKNIWQGCNHQVKPIILDDNEISIMHHLEFVENNPKELCLDCWELEGNKTTNQKNHSQAWGLDLTPVGARPPNNKK